MKKLFLPLCAAALLMLSACGNALAGKWYDAETDAILEFSSGGRMSFSSPLTQYEARYKVSKGRLTLEDEEQTSVLTFTLEGDTLTTTNANGQTFVYEKVR